MTLCSGLSAGRRRSGTSFPLSDDLRVTCRLMRVAAVGGTNNDVAEGNACGFCAYNNLKTNFLGGRRLILFVFLFCVVTICSCSDETPCHIGDVGDSTSHGVCRLIDDRGIDGDSISRGVGGLVDNRVDGVKRGMPKKICV